MLIANSEAQTFGEKYFGTSISTLRFFLLSVATMNFCYFYWMIQFSSAVCDDRREARRNTCVVLTAVGLLCWSIIVAFFSIIWPAMYTLARIMSLTGIIMYFYLSFRLKDRLEKKLSDNGIHLEVSAILSIIFPFLYQYYIVRNAESLYKKKLAFAVARENAAATESMRKRMTDYEELERLAKLKETGVISEEEFARQKKKILG